jgi:hypothetical protein
VDRPAQKLSEARRATKLWWGLASDIVDLAEPESQPKRLYEDISLLIDRAVRAHLKRCLHL